MFVLITLVAQLAAKVTALHNGRTGTVICPLTRLMHRRRALMPTERTLAGVLDFVALQTQIDLALGAVHSRGAVLGIHLTAAREHRGSPGLGCSFGCSTQSHVALGVCVRVRLRHWGVTGHWQCIDISVLGVTV